ncbi:hypothetical protein ACIQLJ_06275 [Microbacterium sp. NPDC091313]
MTLTAPPPDAAAVPDEGSGALLRGIAGGDTRCLAELYDALSGRVYGLARRVVPASAADRVLADVFEEVWRTAERCAPWEDADEWVLAIARRRAVIAARPRPDQPRSTARSA